MPPRRKRNRTRPNLHIAMSSSSSKIQKLLRQLWLETYPPVRPRQLLTLLTCSHPPRRAHGRPGPAAAPRVEHRTVKSLLVRPLVGLPEFVSTISKYLRRYDPGRLGCTGRHYLILPMTPCFNRYSKIWLVWITHMVSCPEPARVCRVRQRCLVHRLPSCWKRRHDSRTLKRGL